MNTSSIRIERTLDSCISAILEQGRTIEECLETYPDQRQELEPSLRLVVRLRAARAIETPQAFRQTAVAQMKEQIATRPRHDEPQGLWQRLREWIEAIRAQTSHFFQKRRYALTMTTASLFLIVLTTIGAGLVHLSAQAMVGDPLYPLKITTEGTRLALSRDQLKNANLRLRFAERRIQETSMLLQAGHYEDLDETLRAYVAYLEPLKPLLSDESALPSDEQLILAQWLVIHVDEHQSQLEALLAYGLLPSTQATVEAALATHRVILEEALLVITEYPTDEIPTPPIPMPTWTLIPSPTFFNPLPGGHPTLPSITLPTKLPTLIPPLITAIPEPSLSPIPWPTDIPTAWPTGWPTAWPTDAPTAWPTEVPTAWPTDAPTAWPTDAPTAWPTDAPTAWPTEAPTAWPTPEPVEWPTPESTPQIPTPPPEPDDPPPPPPSWP